MALKCEICGTTKKKDEVLATSIIWRAGGRNCFDFQWYESKEVHKLCGNCEASNYEHCCECGALIEWENYGTGYLPEDYGGDNICPGCAERKKEFKVNVSIHRLVEESVANV